MIYSFNEPRRGVNLPQLRRWCRGLWLRLYWLRVRSAFGQLDSILDPRVKVGNPRFVFIGAEVSISEYTWILAITGDRQRPDCFRPRIVFERGAAIGRFCQITCSQEVIFEAGCFLSEGILVTDSIHGYEDVSLPVFEQPLLSRGPVRIGAGAWIGSGARIIGRVHIGRNSVVSANAVVVNRDVPERCVVAGVPARVIKAYDPAASAWLPVGGTGHRASPAPDRGGG
jgi:acetyltransferase-like isoleucine patch superfamily enzyme